MMLLTTALALAASTSCIDVKRVCRACPISGRGARCSTIGIACQPSIRICRPTDEPRAPVGRTSAKKRGN